MGRLAAGVLVACVAVTGCATAAPDMAGAPEADEAPWKDQGGGAVITAAPDAGGVLSFRNCPTLDEARSAMPAITAGPDANAVPFKSMVLQCGYTLPGTDASGRPAGVSVLVFDATYEGGSTFERTLDADMGSPTPIEGVGDSASWTGGRGSAEVWVSAGRFGLHLLNSSRDDVPVSELAALAQAAVDALERPPR